eukprot:scaffold1041_cov124-Isochrysis_galbana.AAC.8
MCEGQGEERKGKRKKERKEEGKETGEQEREEQNVQHPAFPRGPPPQYYPGSTRLNFAVRMGSGDFRVIWPHMSSEAF